MMEKKKSSNASAEKLTGKKTFDAIVVGASAGGLEALGRLLSEFDERFPASLIIVQHLYPGSPNMVASILNNKCTLFVKEADEKEEIKPSTVYLAPANYHLLVESDRTLSFSVDEKVNYSRPSIDVLFQSAADVYKSALIGILLTGANSDGARGMQYIRENGGTTIAQDPKTAEVPLMPQAAIDLAAADYILPLPKIYHKVKDLVDG